MAWGASLSLSLGWMCSLWKIGNCLKSISSHLPHCRRLNYRLLANGCVTISRRMCSCNYALLSWLCVNTHLNAAEQKVVKTCAFIDVCAADDQGPMIISTWLQHTLNKWMLDISHNITNSLDCFLAKGHTNIYCDQMMFTQKHWIGRRVLKISTLHVLQHKGLFDFVSADALVLLRISILPFWAFGGLL